MIEKMFHGLPRVSEDGVVEAFIAEVSQVMLPEVPQAPYVLPPIRFEYFDEDLQKPVERCVEIVQHFLGRPIIPYTFSTHEEWIEWKKPWKRSMVKSVLFYM